MIELWQALAGIAVALITGPATAWVMTRSTRKRVDTAVAVAEEVSKSVGVQNGHGTVQDATGEILHELKSIKDQQHTQNVTLESIVSAASTVGDRLKAHDREFAVHRNRLTAIEKRLEESA